jgi:hypothetical protein
VVLDSFIGNLAMNHHLLLVFFTTISVNKRNQQFDLHSSRFTLVIVLMRISWPQSNKACWFGRLHYRTVEWIEKKLCISQGFAKKAVNNELACNPGYAVGGDG